MSLEYCRSIIVRKTWKKSNHLNNSDFTEVRGTHGVMRIKGEKREDVKYRDTLSFIDKKTHKNCLTLLVLELK